VQLVGFYYKNTFCTLAPNTFNKTAASFSLHTEICTVPNAPCRKLHIAVRFKGHSRTVGSQYGTRFKCSFWRLQVKPKVPLHLLEVGCRLDKSGRHGALQRRLQYPLKVAPKWECHGAPFVTKSVPCMGLSHFKHSAAHFLHK
jgi:hypothetical protein